LNSPRTISERFCLAAHEVRHVQNGLGDHIDMVPVKQKKKKMAPRDHIDMVPALG
jgi:hypothetical protein